MAKDTRTTTPPEPLDIARAQLLLKAPVSNPSDWIPEGEYNPHRVRPWVIGNEYGILAVAFGSCEQDAFDAAADEGHLAGLALDSETENEREEENDGEGIMRLGNASEPFDSIYAWIEELPNPPAAVLSQQPSALLDELEAAREVVRAAELAAESLGSHCLEWEDSVSELVGPGHSEKAPGRGAESALRSAITRYNATTSPEPRS